MSKILIIASAILVCIYVNGQENISKKKEPTILVIINGKQKEWTQKQMRDSINWSKVKSVNMLPDSINRVKKYGAKAKYGTTIIKY